MKKALPLYLFLLAQISYAQGLIVNEASNGASGTKEYFELLVIGSDAAPTAPVDLGGWIIDDNNGQFKGGTSTGVAAGHFRIAPGCYSAVPPGSILLIYNAADVDPNIPAADENDANGDSIYIIPHTSACLQVCTGSPTTSSTSYNIGGCTYVATTNSGVTSWTAVGLSNTGDAVQTRRPDGSFYHGFSYGNVGTPFPTFPADFGGGSAFNANTSTGAAFGWALDCGAWTSSASYTRVAAAAGTPGAVNNLTNHDMIQNLRNGSFNYSDLTDINNCILPLYLLDFDATVYNLHSNILNWRLTKVDPNSWVNIQRSENGYDFTTIERMTLEAFIGEKDYSFIDFTPFQTTYYRLKFHEPFAKISYSHVRAVSQKTNDNIRLYPNPTNGRINLALNEALANAARCEVVDALGRVLIQSELPAGHAAMQLETEVLPAGHYFLRLSNEQTALVRPFIKH